MGMLSAAKLRKKLLIANRCLDSKPADPKYGSYLGTRIGLYNGHWQGPSQSWLKALKNDNRMIIWAAKKAEDFSLKFSVPLIQLGHDGFNGGFTNAILP